MRLAILKAARAILEIGGKQYICHAIHRAGEILNAQEQASEMIDDVLDQLDGCGALESWLAQQGIVLWWTTERDRGIQQQMRLAWLDKMIAEQETIA